MKKLYFILPLLFGISCSNNSEVSSEKKEILPNTSNDSIIAANEEIKENEPNTQIFTEADSVIFYNSLAEETKIIDKYCKCAKTKGRTHIDCKDYIKLLSVQQNISDGIRNKYFNNSVVLEKLSQKTNELDRQFNECSN